MVHSSESFNGTHSKNIKRLNVYPWAGHSAIMGRVKRTWQDTEAVLSYFGGCDIEAGGL